MFSSYRVIFQHPGTKAFSGAGFIARMTVSMMGIGIITMIAQLRDSFFMAGVTAAVYTFSAAFCAPLIARLVDRYGQNRILPKTLVISVPATAALLLCTVYDAPDWAIWLSAVFVGAIPSMPAMIRARWTHIYKGDPRLQTAYSFESVLDEISFIIGPPLSVTLCIALFPQAGPLAAIIFLIIGTALVVCQKRTEPPVHKRDGLAKGTVLRLPAIQLLMVVLLALGVIVGTVDVLAVAFANAQGYPEGASYVLSVYAAATLLTTLPLLLVTNLTGLGLTMFVAGFFFSPTMILAIGFVEREAPPNMLTEGFTWLITGLAVGVALGSAGVGMIIDTYGIDAGFLLAIAAGICVLLTACIGYVFVFKDDKNSADK
ncbi:MFS transporter [Morganella morganii]|uniref:MFS transporter n=1 Tax=Morganella morganii TaxID=582 RepID=UPI002856A55A|nr:MFS transporter [Morganella morganii]MDR5686163.1 MFS transporter [Morganella morganii]